MASSSAVFQASAEVSHMDYEVIEGRYVRDYVVWLRFRDGTCGEVDLGPQLYGEVFEPLRDLETFKSFSIRLDTIAWPNNADFAPEFLHERVAVACGKIQRGALDPER